MKTLLWWILALCVGTYICLPVADPDLWWHITAGKWMLAHGTVPTEDYWNTFGRGQPWRAYSWSSEIVLGLVDRLFGDLGLLFLQILLASSLAVTLQLCFGLIARDWFVGALLGVYGTVACYNHFTLRPQVLVWGFFAVLLAVAHRATQDSLFKKTAVLPFFLVGVAWANTHLTAALGLGSVVLFMLPRSLSDRPAFSRLTLAASAFFVGTLVTPYFGGEWLTFISKSGHPLKYSLISEFQPATILQYSTVFVLLSLVLLTVSSFSTRVVPSIGQNILAGGMVLAGLTAVKFLPFAAIVLCALLAVCWREASSIIKSTESIAKKGIFHAIHEVRGHFMQLNPSTVGACAFLLGAITVANISHLIRNPINLKYLPKTSVDFIINEELPEPLLNEFGAGGYLMYRFSDNAGLSKRTVAIDGRTNINPPEIWQMYQESLLGKLGWRNFINKVGAKTILWRQGSPFVSLLFASKEWCRVFSSGSGEDDYVVFVRRDEIAKRSASLTSLNCTEAINFTSPESKVGAEMPTPIKPERSICVSRCGDGVCSEIVCMGEGCPCAETPSNCPADCKR